MDGRAPHAKQVTHLLSLNELPETVGHNAGLVDEEVLTAISGSNEAEALSRHTLIRNRAGYGAGRVERRGAHTFLLSNHLQVPFCLAML